jgi:hypothetical protein
MGWISTFNYVRFHDAPMGEWMDGFDFVPDPVRDGYYYFPKADRSEV